MKEVKEKIDKVEQLTEDLDKIIKLIQKMENSSLEDLDSLKRESIFIKSEFEKRYGESSPTKTNPSEKT